MSAESLQAALQASGIRTAVEARDRLAIITAHDASSARAITTARDRIVALASANGFSHVALEIGPVPGMVDQTRSDAPLPGD